MSSVACRQPGILFELKCHLYLKLHGARGKLVGDSCQWLPEARAGGSSVTIGSAIAHEVRVIEYIEGFGAKIEMHPFMPEHKRALDEWRYVIDTIATSGIAGNHGAVDHRTVRRCSRIAAIGGAGSDVIRQPA